VEARVHAGHRDEAAQQQTRADQQNQRERDLPRDQQPPQTPVPGGCGVAGTAAQLLVLLTPGESQGRMDGCLMELLLPSEVFWTLERARVAERLGDRETAARDYQYVADIWCRADAQLQPYVAEAREGLVRVSGEPRPAEPRG
jgi:hypothetical protein